MCKRCGEADQGWLDFALFHGATQRLGEEVRYPATDNENREGREYLESVCGDGFDAALDDCFEVNGGCFCCFFRHMRNM